MSTTHLALLTIFLMSGAGVIGDLFLKQASKQSANIFNYWFLAGVIIYALTAFGWFFVFRYIKVSSVGILYPIFTAIGLIGIGILVFHERLSTQEIIGLGFGLVSILLLARFE
jgi:multidrug transporter EmrE-like cation transporter